MKDRLKIVVVRNRLSTRYEVQEWRENVYVTVFVGASIRAANDFCRSLKEWWAAGLSMN